MPHDLKAIVPSRSREGTRPLTVARSITSLLSLALGREVYRNV